MSTLDLSGYLIVSTLDYSHTLATLALLPSVIGPMMGSPKVPFKCQGPTEIEPVNERFIFGMNTDHIKLVYVAFD